MEAFLFYLIAELSTPFDSNYKTICVNLRETKCSSGCPAEPVANCDHLFLLFMLESDPPHRRCWWI